MLHCTAEVCIPSMFARSIPVQQGVQARRVGKGNAMIISSILRNKGPRTVTVGPNASLAEVSTTLSNHRIGAVPVLDGDRLAGIVSERDIVTCIARHGA